MLVVQARVLVVFGFSLMQASPVPRRRFPAALRAFARSGTVTCLVFFAFGATITLACKKRPRPLPPEVLRHYQAQADRLCRAVVDCIKADTANRLADQPEQRDMVLGRMSQDLCISNQYQLIGNLSTEPLGSAPVDYNDEQYRRYDRCVEVVTAAADCDTRRDRYMNHPDCRGLRDATPR